MLSDTGTRQPLSALDKYPCHLVRNLVSQAINLALETTMLAKLVREVGDEALFALLDGENVRRRRPKVVLASGDDSIRSGDAIAAEIDCKLHTRQLDSFAKEDNP